MDLGNSEESEMHKKRRRVDLKKTGVERYRKKRTRNEDCVHARRLTKLKTDEN